MNNKWTKNNEKENSKWTKDSCMSFKNVICKFNACLENCAPDISMMITFDESNPLEKRNNEWERER